MQGDNFGSGSFLSSSTQVKGLKSSSPPLSAWYSPFQLNRGARELPPREAHSFLGALQFCLAGELSSQTINQHCQTNHSGQNNRCSDSPSDSKPPDSSNVPPQISPQPRRTITSCKTQRKQGEAPQQFAEPEAPLPFFISKLLQCPVCKQHEQFLCYTTVVSYHAKHKANLPRPPACRPGPFPQQCVVNLSLGKWE